MVEFKPMVKMYTDEPGVILKLKKGGKVHHKASHKAHEEHGHKSMHHMAGGHMHGAHHAFEAEAGKAPKKPGMHERHRAMNPNLYAKGGKVAHKLDGGMMPMRAPAAPMAPMGRQALMAMAPAARAARAAMVRRALTGMKKGGTAGMEKHIEKLEKELKHHEAMPMAKAHHKASGGKIDRAETRTTIEKGAKKFERDFVVTGQKHDKAHGTGEIHEGKPGGYKHGGKAHKKHHYSTGGDIPAGTKKSVNKGKIVMGGTIEDNEGPYLETDVHTATADKAHGTGGVSMSNAGGFRHGGKAKRYAEGGSAKDDDQMSRSERSKQPSENPNYSEVAVNKAIASSNRSGRKISGKEAKAIHALLKGRYASGGAIDSKLTRTTVEGGNWENRPADTAKPGKKGTKTGEVHESNAGGYKRGGHAKKHFATGGNVIDDGKAVKMPHHFVSQPVANSLQSGTFKRGGKVRHHADGGPADPQQAANEKAYRNWQRSQTEENEADRNLIPNLAKRAVNAVRGMFGSSTPPSPPPGSVTETNKTVTVAPAKKRGGRC
jgi:hypothetical protein